MDLEHRNQCTPLQKQILQGQPQPYSNEFNCSVPNLQIMSKNQTYNQKNFITFSILEHPGNYTRKCDSNILCFLSKHLLFSYQEDVCFSVADAKTQNEKLLEDHNSAFMCFFHFFSLMIFWASNQQENVDIPRHVQCSA